MDISTILGFVVALVCILVSFMMEGGNVASLLALPPILIVFGGTIGATVASFPLKDSLKMPKLIVKAIKGSKTDFDGLSKYLIKLSETARQEGILSIEHEVESASIKKFNPLLKDALELVIDGSNMELIKTMIENKIAVDDMNSKREAAIFEAAGGYSPTMGIIGTVTGLIRVLGNISSADKLSESIASAFIATLYGISFANILWLPIATKLKNIASTERLEKELILEASLSLQAGDSPRVLEKKLKTFVQK